MYNFDRLSNKLRLITIPMSGTNTVTALVMVRTGSKYENKNNNGISHFLEHIFFKGTKKRPDTLAISSELDRVGGEYNAFTGKEYTGYWVKAEKSQIELALDVVSDMLHNSKFEASEIEREKGVIVEEFNMYRDNPMMYIEDLFEECLYGDQPAGWDTIGTKENILKFKRQDFINYFTSQYNPQNTIVCLAGDIKRIKALKLINKYFPKLKTSEFNDKLPVKEKQTKPQVKLHYKKTDQAHLSLGVRAFSVNHKDELILKVIGMILGGSMSSRLFIELRERQGLAYYVRSNTELYTDSGYLTTQAGVPLDKAHQAIKIILSQYRKLILSQVSQNELNKIKQFIKGRLTLQLESSSSVANWYTREVILRNKILTPDNFFRAIKKVTPMDIKRVAKEIFINRGLNLAVVGPFRGWVKFERILKL